MTQPLGIAVVGAGYWGPNLVRNIAQAETTCLRWVCDLDAARAERLARPWAGARSTASLDQVLDDPDVRGVALATPPATHADLALRCFAAGKHVLVEKPLATSVGGAEQMVAAAAAASCVLMCDHTYCYTPAVRYIRSALAAGVLGDLHYVDSVRINLGLVQRDVDVIWDLAPHDLSILDHVLPDVHTVRGVYAHGADPIGSGRACVGYVGLQLGGDALANLTVNWLSPTKVRTMMIGGSQRTLVWNDLDPSQRVVIYDRGVDLEAAEPGDGRAARIAYRLGDMAAPALGEVEALSGVIAEFVDSIREHREPLTGGASGVAVLRILEAASASLLTGGLTIPVVTIPVATTTEGTPSCRLSSVES